MPLYIFPEINTFMSLEPFSTIKEKSFKNEDKNIRAELNDAGAEPLDTKVPKLKSIHIGFTKCVNRKTHFP